MHDALVFFLLAGITACYYAIPALVAAVIVGRAIEFVLNLGA